MQIGLLVFKRISISKQHTFNKEERLKSRKLIDHLFSKGKSFSVFPVKVLYDFVELNNESRLQAGVTVSSRNFKKAVHRNRIKRVLREAYRLQKLSLQHTLSQRGLQLAVFFIYTGKELPVYADVSEKIAVILNRLTDTVAKTKEL